MKSLAAIFLLALSTQAYSAPLPEGGLKINFAPAATISPEGYFTDNGKPFADGRGDGTQTYGWVDANGNPEDISRFIRNRAPSPDIDVLRETLIHMNHPSTSAGSAFQVELPNGDYRITVQVGDVLYEGTSGVNHVINAEDENVITFGALVDTNGVRNATATVSVTDGMLNIDQNGGYNTKLHLLIVEAVDATQTPVILGSTPVDGEKFVEINTTISANFIDLPNASANGATSLNNDTITTDTVQLFEVATGAQVSGSVNGTGGGDAINFTPASPLKTQTEYRYMINGVQDLSGETLLPFTSEFTTGTDTTTNTGFEDVAFEKVGPLVAGTRYSSLTMGPDNRLYGLTITGSVHRWDVNADGTLDNQTIINTLGSAYGGAPRLAIGLAFDPSSSADNPVAYVTHSSFTFSGGPAYDGNISRLSGVDLETHELVVTGLPRSVRDHLTNSLAFRPGEAGVLYFTQGSNSAGGAPDGAWGNRPERLLSAACLRLDLNKLPASLPLDVTTSDDQAVINNASVFSPTTDDGKYNPYYQDAPLTLYATGVRNAYDLIWHSNGQLYIPTNGTAGGSYSPASVTGTRRVDGSFYAGQTVPQVGPSEVQRDFLFRIDPTTPVGYYGHPNPLRGEYVMNRGREDVGSYAASIAPDANYRGFAFDFAFNISPNGVIEYQSNAHNGNLQGALLVARYSGGSDIIALKPNGTDGDIGESRIGIPGLTGFKDPLEITEDTRYGHLYVSDYGDSELYLLRPVIPAVVIEPQAPSITLNDPVANVGNTAGSITAVASDSDGSIASVSFYYNGDNFLGTLEEAPYTFGWDGAPNGTYTLTAVATDNEGLQTTSNAVVVVVDDTLGNPNQAPTITLNAPVANAGNTAGSITAIASDADGSIAEVSFYYGGDNFLGTVTAAPYQFAWDGAPDGTYTLTAVVTDNEGAQTTSNAVVVTVDNSITE